MQMKNMRCWKQGLPPWKQVREIKILWKEREVQDGAITDLGEAASGLAEEGGLV